MQKALEKAGVEFIPENGGGRGYGLPSELDGQSSFSVYRCYRSQVEDKIPPAEDNVGAFDEV